MTTSKTPPPSRVRIDLGEGVLSLGLTRPGKLNALDRASVEVLCEQLSLASATEEVRGIVFYGEGRGFSAGGDLHEIFDASDGADPSPRLETMRVYHALVRAVWESPVPVLAAVHGPVYGAAFNLVLACDLVIAAAETRFCQVFSRIGVVPDLAGVYLLPRAVGLQRAKQLMFYADEVSAEQAMELGFVNEVVESRQEALGRARELAERLRDVPRLTLSLTKELVNRSMDLSFGESLRHEALAQTAMLGSPQARELMQHFVKRRREAQPVTEAAEFLGRDES